MCQEVRLSIVLSGHVPSGPMFPGGPSFPGPRPPQFQHFDRGGGGGGGDFGQHPGLGGNNNGPRMQQQHGGPMPPHGIGGPDNFMGVNMMAPNGPGELCVGGE